jgi:protein-tyrosine phosphatase
MTRYHRSHRNEEYVMPDLSELPIQLDFEGANNFREMGGYPVGGNSRVRRGLLFRSDQLGRLTTADREKLSELGIKTVVDFRRESERLEIMDNLGDSSIRELWLPVTAEGADVVNLRRGIEDGSLGFDQARDYLVNANRQFIELFNPVFKSFMDLLLDSDNYPLVFHCSAGKDRAGFAAAVALLSVGASKETVMHDYLATNHCTANYVNGLYDSLSEQPATRAGAETVRMLMRVDPDFIGAAFGAIERNHGDTDSYLARALELDESKREVLRAILCENN